MFAPGTAGLDQHGTWGWQYLPMLSDMAPVTSYRVVLSYQEFVGPLPISILRPDYDAQSL